MDRGSYNQVQEVGLVSDFKGSTMSGKVITTLFIALCVMCAATFGLIVGSGYGKEFAVLDGELKSSSTGMVVSARQHHTDVEDPFSDEFLASAGWLSLYGEDGTSYRQQILSISKTPCADVDSDTCVDGYSHLYQTTTGFYVGSLRGGYVMFSYLSNEEAKQIPKSEVLSASSSGFHGNMN